VRLKFEPFNGRHPNYRPIVDETGKRVGSIQSNGSGIDGIQISLFDGKYRTTVKNYYAAGGFILGVPSGPQSHNVL
jgi:hypothetical protein